MAADSALLKMAAMRRGRPSGSRWLVLSASWLPVTVASTAPRKPTHSVRCCVRLPADGMSPRISRATDCAMGSATMAPSVNATSGVTTRASTLSDGGGRGGVRSLVRRRDVFRQGS